MSIRRASLGATIAFACAVVGSHARAADIEPYQEYSQRIEAAGKVSALTPDLFGDKVNLFDRQTEFENVDIDLPGNNRLPVELRRVLRVERDPVDFAFKQFGGLGNWEIDVPHISGTFAAQHGWAGNRCSSPVYPAEITPFFIHDIWKGNSIHIPGRGDMKMIRSSAASKVPTNVATNPWTTSDFSAVTCTQMEAGGAFAGQGFIVHTPDGLRYTFNVARTRTNGTLKYTSPQGATFKQVRVKHYILASKIEDRFGNTVTYKYDGLGYPTSITSGDGRSITLTYTAGRLATARVGAVESNRVWSYEYLADKLTKVELPDQTTWTYGYAGSTSWLPSPWDAPMGPTCTESAPLESGAFNLTVTHPSKAKGVFEFSYERQYRSGVSRTYCNVVHIAQGPGGVNGYAMAVPHHFDIFKLNKRTITGAALDTLVWTYADTSYQYPLCGTVPGLCPNEARRKITVVQEPGGRQQRHHYGVLFGINEGRLLATFTRTPGGTVVRGETIDYVTDAEAAQFPFADTYGNGWGIDTAMDVKIRPTKRKLIAQDGTIVEPAADLPPPSSPPPTPPTPPTWPQPCEPGPLGTCLNPVALLPEEEDQALVIAAATVPPMMFLNEVQAFDSFARATKVLKQSSIDLTTVLASRTEGTVYADNIASWVLGQVASVTCLTSVPAHGHCNGNDVMSKTDYDPVTALPTATYAFGKKQRTYTYNLSLGSQGGTLASISDGRDSTAFETTMHLSDWKLGVPQKIWHPATPDHPAVAQGAGVDENGWIDWVTDENGYKTCYTQDVMGRTASITYPMESTPTECDEAQVSWKKTIITFNGTTAAAYGLPAGHFRQTTTTDKFRKTVFFDAFWRPIFEQTIDYNNIDSTISATARRYDVNGRLAFESYRVADPVAQNNVNLKGVKTEYDALDRVTARRQDAEGGAVLSTTTAYTPSRLKTEVIEPNLNGTHTWFIAYDTPNYDLPIQMYHSEATATKIDRDPMGKLLALTRRNISDPATIAATRTYTYDIHHQLCRTVEPETGATLYGYDPAWNLVWSATGLPDATPCETSGESTAVAARRVDRLLDNRNRLQELSFPDGRGDQSWEYTKDGLPSKVHTVNVVGANNINNAYLYNSRRLLKAETQLLPEWYTFRLTYGYDGYGNLSTLQYPSGRTVQFTPNALGQPTLIQDSAAGGSIYASNIQYHRDGQVKGFNFGNGVVYNMVTNERGLPKTIDHGAATRLSYVYDGNGNVTGITDHVVASHSRAMTYDGLNRLKTVVSSMLGAGGASYTYNQLDNLTRVKVGGANNPRDHYYCYDARNRLTFIRSASSCASSPAVSALGYDAQGNVQFKNQVDYDFDFGNRLREVIGVERYRYDAFGRRLLAMNFATGTVTSQYGKDGQLFFQKSSRPAESNDVDHIYLAGMLIAQRTVPHSGATASVRFVHTDALGSPVETTSSAAGGGTPERTEYEPYGDQLVVSASIGKDRQGYTGHVRDQATGLSYMQQRYYDPEIGRFLSVDPVAAEMRNGANFNRYWYAANNPYRFIDPDGRLDREHKDRSSLNRFNSQNGNVRVAFTRDNKSERLANAESQVSGLRESVEGTRHRDPDQAAKLFDDVLQPIVEKFGFEIFADIDTFAGNRLTSVFVSPIADGDGLGYTGSPPYRGLPTIHGHTGRDTGAPGFSPFSSSDLNWYNSTGSNHHYVTGPEGAFRFNGRSASPTRIQP